MKVKLDTKTVEVEKLPIGRYSEVLKIIREFLPKLNLDQLSSSSNDALLAMIPDLIADNLPEAIKLITVGTGLSTIEVESLGLAECVDLIMAIIEVNRYADVWEKLKKGLTLLPKTSTQPKATGSQTQ